MTKIVSELLIGFQSECLEKMLTTNFNYVYFRSISKSSSSRSTKIKKVGDMDNGLKVIDKWIKDIDDLHRSRPAPTIQYSKTMPEIDQLMQV